jgi:tRNA (cmo5U34)-methyltransferase
MNEPELNIDSRPEVWLGDALVRTYLQDVRAGIPNGVDQIEIALRVAAALHPAVANILDLGCGDGIVGSAARQIWPKATLTLLDFSDPMLEAARSRFLDASDVAFVRADFGLPGWIGRVSDRSPFDLVLSAYAIHHQPDDRKRALYREIVDLLAPGGVFINIEHVQSATTRVSAIWDQLLVERLIQQHPDRDPAVVEREYAKRPDRAANRLAPVEIQLEWLRKLGLIEVDCYFKVLELAVFGGQKGAT